MSMYDLEAAFGGADKTSRAMKAAIREWFRLYYGDPREGENGCQRVAYTVVNKLIKTVFAEYQVKGEEPFTRQVADRLSGIARQAVELALVGGECYLKPCPEKAGFSFTLIPRDRVLILGRDARGEPIQVGFTEQSVSGRYYYTLLEKRTWEKGLLTVENTLYRSHSRQQLGVKVKLSEHPGYGSLPEKYVFAAPMSGLGLIRVKTPMLNCVDGSADGVSVYAPAAELIRLIDENEAQLRGEFQRGQSRVFASRDLLDGENGLVDSLFVGLDEDPQTVGLTVYAPQLRQEAYLERKQEYLRNVESIVGLKRGMLSDANMDDRTATEISASASEFQLTVLEFQRMWQKALEEAVAVCAELARYWGQAVTPGQLQVQWGNGVLYDGEQTFQGYRQLVLDGLLKPEIALGMKFDLPADTEEEQARIRRKYMPALGE